MKFKIFTFLFFLTTSISSQVQDTSGWYLIRYKIQDESFFIKLNPNATEHYLQRGNLKFELKDFEGSIQDYTKAIEIDPGYDVAFYNRGLSKSELKDFGGAIQDYIKAASRGYMSAQNKLGYLYETGNEIKQSDSLAFFWYRKAAEKGNKYSQFNLGRMYEYGKGITQNDSIALFWYKNAAENGDLNAQYKVGNMYLKGKGCIQNDNLAFNWYQKAAQNNLADAQFQMGWMYRKGKGTKQSDSLAVLWYQKAANNGDSDAQSNLGFMYSNGYGVNKNDSIAMKWYKLAANQGNDLAKNNLNELLEKINGRNPALYLKPKYKKGLTEKDKKAIQNFARTNYDISGNFNFNITLEDLEPFSNRIPEQPANMKRLKELKEKLKLNTKDVVTFINIGCVFKDFHLKDSALFYLNKADSLAKENFVRNPLDSTQLIYRIFSNMNKEDFYKSIDECNIYLNKFHDNNTANILKLMAYMGLGDRNKIIEISDSLISKNPDVAVNYLFVELTNVMNAASNIEKGLTIVSKEERPDDIYDIHRITEASKKYPQNFEIQFIYQAIHEMVFMLKFITLEGKLSKSDKLELNKMKEFYLSAIEKKDLPSKFVFYKLLGILSYISLENKDAIVYTEKAIEIKNNEASSLFSSKEKIYNQLIAFYLIQNKVKQSRKVLEEKIQKIPESYQNAEDYVFLSKYQFNDNENNKAEKSCLDALEINPYIKDAYLGLAIINIEYGNITKAKDYLDKVPEQDKDQHYYTTKGILYLLLGEYNYSFNCFKKAQEIDKDFKTPQNILNEYFLVSKS